MVEVEVPSVRQENGPRDTISLRVSHQAVSARIGWRLKGWPRV